VGVRKLHRAQVRQRRGGRGTVMGRGRAGVGSTRTRIRATVITSVIVATVSPFAHAGPLEDAGPGLAASSGEKIEESIRKLEELDDPRAIPALDALCDDRLRVGADKQAYLWDVKTHDARNPLTGQIVSPVPGPLKEVEVGNEIRRVALPVLAQLQLGAPAAS